MGYTYDRRVASNEVQVTTRIDGAWAVINVLLGISLGSYKKRVENVLDAEKELLDLKLKIESVNNDARINALLDAAGFEFDHNLRGLDHELSQEQQRRHAELAKENLKSLKAWFRNWIVDFVEGTYVNYTKSLRKKEPCVTAGYVRGMILEGGVAPQDMSTIFKTLSTKQQLGICDYALKQARSAGKLQASLGVNWDGNEARCYEPA
jgi:hypothetical protein